MIQILTEEINFFHIDKKPNLKGYLKSSMNKQITNKNLIKAFKDLFGFDVRDSGYATTDEHDDRFNSTDTPYCYNLSPEGRVVGPGLSSWSPFMIQDNWNRCTSVRSRLSINHISEYDFFVYCLNRWIGNHPKSDLLLDISFDEMMGTPTPDQQYLSTKFKIVGKSKFIPR